jgi:hypothetical protein
MTWTPAPTTCVRKAWLVMGATTVQLDNEAGGWFCTSLDLGYPEIRDVMTNRPDRDGVIDRTLLMGSRAITIAITTLVGAGARIDQVAASFAPFMQASARSELHYVLDRLGTPGQPAPNPERMIRPLRPAGYSWPIEGDNERDIQLQFVASDSASLDPNQQTAVSYAGSSSAPGRTYNLVFNRIYPVGGGSPTTGYLQSYGDLPWYPLLRLYGPITAPYLFIGTSTTLNIQFQNSFTLGAGQYVEVDCFARTAWLNGDHTKPALSSINWSTTRWGPIPGGGRLGTRYPMNLYGSSTAGVTQVQAFWNDRFMS